MKITRNEDVSDDDILAGLKAGWKEREKFQTKLYNRFMHLIKMGARKYNMTEEKSASAYSDAIIAVIKNIITEKYEGRSSLQSYVYSIFFNKCIDEVRNEAKHTKAMRTAQVIDNLIETLPDKTGSIISSLIKKQEWLISVEKLAALGKKCYDLLLLWGRYYSDKEIAEMMEYGSPKVVRVTRARCLEKLKQKEI